MVEENKEKKQCQNGRLKMADTKCPKKNGRQKKGLEKMPNKTVNRGSGRQNIWPTENNRQDWTTNGRVKMGD